MVRTVYTIGHSSHDLTTFFSLLKRFHIDTIVDIRRSPRSTRFPHFNSEYLSSSSFNYLFRGDILGGRRQRRKSLEHLNDGLVDDDDLHAYADHMQRIEFQQCVNECITFSSQSLVLMCAENHPSQCHRTLLADYLVLVHQIDVIHILGSGETFQHQLNPIARFNESKRICYYPSSTNNQQLVGKDNL